jgi:hypothetical protein
MRVSDAQAQDGGACASQPAQDDDDTGQETSFDAGSWEDERISVDWIVHGLCEGGACMDMRLTNLGTAVSTWTLDWHARVLFDPEFELTEVDINFYDFADESSYILPFDASVCRVCLRPFAEPIAIRADYAPAP